MPRVVTLVTWIAAPEWLTISEASYLSGHDADLLHELILAGDIDALQVGDRWLIDKGSLREYQEALLDVWSVISTL
jgi:hypothetical protein